MAAPSAVFQRIQSNSVLQEVCLEDIRPLLTSHVRRNSCHCEACGGEKLAKVLRRTAIPLATATTTSTLKSRLICRARRPAMTEIGRWVGPAPSLFRPPPVTPALHKLLSTLTTKHIATHNVQSSKRLIRTSTRLHRIRRVPSYYLPTGLSAERLRKPSLGSWSHSNK